MYLITNTGCQPCQTAKAKIKEYGLPISVLKLTDTTEEGKDVRSLVLSKGLRVVPILLDDDYNVITVGGDVLRVLDLIAQEGV